MAGDIDFYFDFSSPYGYFGAERIDALAAKFDRRVNWRPVLLGAIFKTTGCQPLPLIPIKGQYAVHDMQRTARLHGIPFTFPQKFPISSQLAARAVLWTGTTHGQAKAGELARALYRAYFVDGRDITDAATVADVAGALDIDTAAVADAVVSEPVKEQLRAEVEAAMKRGVFGSPFMIVDGEPFWGFDRFEQLEAWLKAGGF